MFRFFFSIIFRESSAVLCAVIIPPAEDGREKRPKHVGVLYLQTRF